MKKHFNTFKELQACVGQDVAVSDWCVVTQAQINQFADATHDHQWIHVDEQKAA
ncbi:MAG: MaoC/PaaZ C-terminal domain-containing protein, partial [Burkholderiales bacterium]